jgi:hypothetical protein
MSSKSCRLEGRADLNGVSCWKVYLEATDVRAQKPISVSAFFDPRHGYLPCQIEVKQLENPVPEDWHMTWAVVEFQVVPNADSSLRWFPRVSEFRQHIGVITATVTQFAIDQPLPDSMFSPNLSAGAQVADHTAENGTRNYFVGAPARVDADLKKLTAAENRPRLSDESSRAASGPVVGSQSAAPPRSGLWTFALATASIATLAAGILIRRFVKR